MSQPISPELLLELEQTEKTRQEKIVDWIIACLPILTCLIALGEYYYVPNYGRNLNTHVYGIFLLLGIGCYLIFFLQGIQKPGVFKRVRYYAPFISLVFILFTIYDYLTLKTNTLALPYFPWVDNILNVAIEDRAYLAESLVASVKLLLTGYAIGVGLGLITGVLAGYSKGVRYWIQPFMNILGPIPTTTWLPIVMVLATTLFKGALFIIALGVWYAVTLATMTGIQNIDPAYFEAAQTLGSSTKDRVFKIAVPAASPNIFQGLTQGMTSATTSLLVAEMLGVEAGLGWYITWQRSWAQYAKMYAAIILLAFTFLAVNYLLGLIRDYVLKWQERS
ncbi:ABC transporter permease [Hutsoniella sourekii]|uniref:ABC transporter permease n=1 Tax=Hutsoniella sourekii TaxID=87650 RepID=UPI0004B8E0E1|nr:ABC transporter permease subunit [Hutsoniella sourekii]